MGKINKLDESVYNMIAAGEVVERPASVVKELIENAIDAGATEIDAVIDEGGTRLIQVSDNGSGILKDDIRSAFLPHATSKIKKAEDLDTVATLGFRGEALPSIASVSEISLVSSTTDDGSAYKIELSGGTVVQETIASRGRGTTISVNNLFFNTPARIKFLKKPHTERSYIVEVVRAEALANPDMRFTLYDGNSKLLSTEGSGDLREVISSVYDANTASLLYAVDYTSKNGIIVRGYSSSVDASKPTRTYETAIVNGRTVSDTTISTAAEKAYTPFLMKHNFPLFVLDILVPFDDVDVNVHPSKTEVRFADKSSVFSAVFHAVQNAVNANVFAGEYKNYSEDEVAADGNPLSGIRSSSGYAEPDSKPVYSQMRIDTSAIYSGKSAPKNYNFGYGSGVAYDKQVPFFTAQNKPEDCDEDFEKASLDYIRAAENRKNNYSSTTFEPDPYAPQPDKTVDRPTGYNGISFKNENQETDFTHNSNARIFDGKILGQIFNTYILVERDDFLYVIDQHAAHERILFDKLFSQFSVEYSEQLLIPYKFKLSAEETEYFDKIIPVLNDCGFNVEFKFGNYLMYAMPAPVARMDFKKFLAELFNSRQDGENFKLKDVLHEKICRTACRAAIKGGDPLTAEQIEAIIQTISDNDGNLPLKCPHGRPAVIKMSKTDFEKMFKRIV